jgi:methionine synthase II (cobalamin-independent)
MYISLDHGHLSPQDYTSQYTLYHTSSPAPNCLQVPNPRTMSRWVTQEYHIHKQEIRENMATAISRIHLAFDLWTSN